MILTDIYGKRITTLDLNSGSANFEFDGLACGIYFASLVIGEELITSLKIIYGQ